MKVAIIDDRADDREYLFGELNTVLREKGYQVEGIDTFPGGEQFLVSFDKGKYDLIFFDIYMDGMTGIQAASEVRRTDTNVRIIFVTTSNDFAAESYSLRADYYLLKPYVHDDIVKAVNTINLADYERQRVVNLPDGNTCFLHDIIYSEYYNHRIVLHLKNGRNMKFRASQAKMEEILCSNMFFVTCTKGIIINLEYVKKIDDGMVCLEENCQVPVSRRRMSEIRKAHAEYLFRQVRM